MTDGEHSFTTTGRMRHATFDEVGRRRVGCSFSAYLNCKVSKSWPLVFEKLNSSDSEAGDDVLATLSTE